MNCIGRPCVGHHFSQRHVIFWLFDQLQEITYKSCDHCGLVLW